MKILVADDDAVPRRFLQGALMKAGHEVVVARSGEEAWQMLHAPQAPQLAILDWLMPDLDGVEICRRVRQWEKAAYVYIILLTSKDQPEDVIAGFDAGADDYLTKPFDPQELESRLRAGQRIIDLQTALLVSLDKLAQAHQRETEIGAKIQQSLLCGQPPHNLNDARVAALTVPSHEVDGDFYDFFRHSGRCLDIVVGDVMGKGVPAALLGAALKSAPLRALSSLLTAPMPGILPEPEEIVRHMHNDVTKQLMQLGVFATLCYARLDLERSEITLVDCGHTKTVHFRHQTRTCALLQGDNMPLGFSEHERYQQVTFPLAAGDMLVFYSDGVTEARNAAGEFFGVERLMEVLHTQYGLEPEQLIDAVKRAVTAFTGTEAYADDFTCVIVTLDDTRWVLPMAQAHYDVTSRVLELAPMRAFVRTFCQELPVGVLDDESIGQLELAVTEAASNIMRHAYQGRTDQPIQMVADAFPDRIVIRLWHRGASFDPKAVLPPAFDGSRDHGFGVYIMTHSVDEVHYVQDEEGEKCTCLVKRRKVR
ncbi:MAG: SpoIIE family protein phosphatase [Candidatus Tectimicrobiota bacterium]